jgi:hypothetical protein
MSAFVEKFKGVGGKVWSMRLRALDAAQLK